ncbi:hypothetical protein Dimus_038159 [Dionaea muscipula]
MGRRPGAGTGGTGGRGRGRSTETAHLQDRSPSSPNDPSAYVHHASTSSPLQDYRSPLMASPSATPTPPSGTEQGSFTTPAGLPQLFIDHHDMYMSNGLSVAHRIYDMIKSLMDGPYRNWSHTPHGVRDRWFEEFRICLCCLFSFLFLFLFFLYTIHYYTYLFFFNAETLLVESSY